MFWVRVIFSKVSLKFKVYLHRFKSNLDYMKESDVLLGDSRVVSLIDCLLLPHLFDWLLSK